VIGTSALVYPAAGLPKLAAANGARIIEINPRPAELDIASADRLVGEAGVIMPALVAAAWPP
jgi:NAD-dependent deacetylase